MASVPSGVDVMESKANKILSSELDRLTEESRLYRQIANRSSEFDYDIEATGESISPEQARERLESITKRTMAIKASLANEKKASQEKSGGPTINLAVVVQNAVDNIKAREGESTVVEAITIGAD